MQFKSNISLAKQIYKPFSGQSIGYLKASKMKRDTCKATKKNEAKTNKKAKSQNNSNYLFYFFFVLSLNKLKNVTASTI